MANQGTKHCTDGRPWITVRFFLSKRTTRIFEVQVCAGSSCLRCDCAVFRRSGECMHTREVAGSIAIDQDGSAQLTIELDAGSEPLEVELLSTINQLNLEDENDIAVYRQFVVEHVAVSVA